MDNTATPVGTKIRINKVHSQPFYIINNIDIFLRLEG